MRALRPIVVGSLASATALALACSSGTSGQGSASATSCGRLFDALIGCSGTGMPDGEVSRLRPRWDALCESSVSLPGQGVTADSIAACAGAIQTRGCAELTDLSGPCLVSAGSLPGGSSCVTDSQCQSGTCTASTGAADGGSSACGTCHPMSGIGEPCQARSCGAGATCSFTGQGNTCVAKIVADVGGSCDGLATECRQGFTCNASTHRCATPASTGQPCAFDLDCAKPLVCPPAKGQTTCQSPGGPGASCSTDTHCAAGLGCDPSSSTCSPVTWVAAGQSCGGNTRCLVGVCQIATATGDGGADASSGTCPRVIPDGQPCDDRDASATCDTFAQCTGGVCTVGYDGVCR